jgi:hypothetical protein
MAYIQFICTDELYIIERASSPGGALGGIQDQS